MTGQAVVKIGDKEWLTDVATLPWELSQGLGGLVEISPATGMLFDLSYEQTIDVTTTPMLFPLDIAFISDDLVITEVYQNVKPECLITSQFPARYFLEVNAGELADIEPGTSVSVEYLAVEGIIPAESDIMSAIVPFVGFLVMGTISIITIRDTAKEVINNNETL